MLWIIPAWVASLLCASLLGYHYRGVTRRIEQLEETVRMKADKQPEPEEPLSTLIDPTDAVQEAIYEHKKLMEKLNGKNH